MGTIQQGFKEYSGKTATYSVQVADVTPANWATEEPNFAAVTTAVSAITNGAQSDRALIPTRDYTPDVAPPTDANAQLGNVWEVFGTDSVNGRTYLLASIPTADAMAGGSSLLIAGTDQADDSLTLVSDLFDALDAVNPQSPRENAIVAGSYTMFLSNKSRGNSR